MPDPEDQPRIGPFSIQVPPPSTNGHHSSRSSAMEPLRRAAPGLVIALILSVSTVPKIALLGTAHFAYWWRIAIAAGLGGVVCGLVQRGSAWMAAATGALVAIAALLLAYTIVRGQVVQRASTGAVLSDVGRLAAWGLLTGGATALAGWGGRRLATSRRGERSGRFA